MGCSLKFLGEPLAAENIHACPLNTLAFGRSGIASNTGTVNGVLTMVKHCKPASSLPESCFPFPEHSDVQEGVRDDPHRHPHPSEVSGVHVAWREAHSLPQLAASTLALCAPGSLSFHLPRPCRPFGIPCVQMAEPLKCGSHDCVEQCPSPYTCIVLPRSQKYTFIRKRILVHGSEVRVGVSGLFCFCFITSASTLAVSGLPSCVQIPRE